MSRLKATIGMCVNSTSYSLQHRNSPIAKDGYAVPLISTSAIANEISYMRCSDVASTYMCDAYNHGIYAPQINMDNCGRLNTIAISIVHT